MQVVICVETQQSKCNFLNVLRYFGRISKVFFYQISVFQIALWSYLMKVGLYIVAILLLLPPCNIILALINAHIGLLKCNLGTSYCNFSEICSIFLRKVTN